MRHLAHGENFSRNSKLRQEMRLRQLASMRAAKARKRLDNPPERAPKRERYFPLEFGVRVKATGEMAWHDLRSVRHAAQALSLILKFCPHGS